MLQVPIPPTPPTPPFDPGLFLPGQEAPMVVIVVVASLAAATLILWPIVRALARRLESKAPADPALRAEVEQLRQHAAEVDALETRVAELEDRVDFAERLLAQRREPERIPRG